MLDWSIATVRTNVPVIPCTSVTVKVTTTSVASPVITKRKTGPLPLAGSGVPPVAATSQANVINAASPSWSIEAVPSATPTILVVTPLPVSSPSKNNFKSNAAIGGAWLTPESAPPSVVTVERKPERLMLCCTRSISTFAVPASNSSWMTVIVIAGWSSGLPSTSSSMASGRRLRSLTIRWAVAVASSSVSTRLDWMLSPICPGGSGM